MERWSADWAWGVPLAVLSVVVHAYCLGLLERQVVSRLFQSQLPRRAVYYPVLMIGGSALAATLLLAAEGLAWALAYLLLGAVTNWSSAILYSLNAITSYGHVTIFLEEHWQMMGALESLTGCILFGLTTAYLFTVMQRAWAHNDKGHGK